MAASLLLSHPPTTRSHKCTLFNSSKPSFTSPIPPQHNGNLHAWRRRASLAGKRQMASMGHGLQAMKKKIVCLQASNEDGEEGEEGKARNGGRRELIQAASIGGLSLLAASPLSSSSSSSSSRGYARAAPIVPPDLTKCGPATVNTPQGLPTAPTMNVNCCLLPPTKPIINYTLPYNPTSRKRRPAHTVDDLYIAKYNKAYELMTNLPSSDPRNLMRQADIHCAFCNGAYNQLGSSTNKLEVHFSWLFLPWHRWYLYFHERILGQLIGDPHFSLVYWNWDNQENVGGNIMPTMFTQQGSSLYDAKRNQNHLPPVLNTLNITDLASTSLSNDQIIKDNLNVMYQSIVTASTPNLFMGKKYSAGDPEPNIGGTLEMAPHTAIHAWTGSDKETYLEDMGNFYSAARDPIFFSHHANVDRLWTVWNTIGGRRRDHTDPDFLNAEFLFYDENGQMVRVKVADALDSSKLGVSYAKAKGDDLWRYYEPMPLSSTTSKQVAPGALDNILELGPASEDASSVKVDKTYVSLAKRPSTIPQDLVDKGFDKDDLEEVLVLQHVEVPRNVATHIAVFINLPNASAETPLSIAEYVGSFINVPHLVGEGMNMSTRSCDIRFGITDNIKRLGITDLSTISVTIVAKVGGTEEVPITLKGIYIEYD